MTSYFELQKGIPHTKADIGKVLPPVNKLSWIKPVELPKGHEEPCPMCGVVDDRDPSKNRIGSGKVRHDFINSQPKSVNGYIFKPGVSVVEYLCEVCGGTGAVWVTDETGAREPAEQIEAYAPKQYLTAPKVPTPDPLYGGCTLGVCRGCHQVAVINVDCYCEKC